jgi:hypothetical protein
MPPAGRSDSPTSRAPLLIARDRATLRAARRAGVGGPKRGWVDAAAACSGWSATPEHGRVEQVADLAFDVVARYARATPEHPTG